MFPSRSLDSELLVRDAQGFYRSATADQVLEAARQAVDKKLQRDRTFRSPADVSSYLCAKLAGLDREVFAVLFLDTRHRLIQYVEMFHGTIDGAEVHPREVLREALRLNAAALIFAHNHPSGIAEPSAKDRLVTARLKEALALIDVRVLDHIIVGGSTTVSLAERGWL